MRSNEDAEAFAALQEDLVSDAGLIRSEEFTHRSNNGWMEPKDGAEVNRQIYECWG